MILYITLVFTIYPYFPVDPITVHEQTGLALQMQYFTGETTPCLCVRRKMGIYLLADPAGRQLKDHSHDVQIYKREDVYVRSHFRSCFPSDSTHLTESHLLC